MKNLKSEKGAITIIVLASVLLFTAVLGSTYMILANKLKTQNQVFEETRKLYEKDIAGVYNSFFSDSATVPIYENSQYLKIATGENIQIGDKYYKFSVSNVYTLMNDLVFYAEELSPDELAKIPADGWLTKKGAINYNRTYSKNYI